MYIHIVTKPSFLLFRLQITVQITICSKGSSIWSFSFFSLTPAFLFTALTNSNYHYNNLFKCMPRNSHRGVVPLVRIIFFMLTQIKNLNLFVSIFK